MCLFYDASDSTAFKHCNQTIGVTFFMFLLWDLLDLFSTDFIRDLQ